MVALLQIEFLPLLFSSQEESVLGISKAFLDDPECSRNEPKRELRPQSEMMPTSCGSYLSCWNSAKASSKAARKHCICQSRSHMFNSHQRTLLASWWDENWGAIKLINWFFLSCFRLGESHDVSGLRNVPFSFQHLHGLFTGMWWATGNSHTLSREVQWALVVVFAVENLESVFPLVLLRGLADLQPRHLLTSSNPHVLTGWDLSLSTVQHGWAQLTSRSHAHTCEGMLACLSVLGLVCSLTSGWGLFTRLLMPMV